MKRSEHVVVAEVQGEPRLLHLQTWTYLTLNETAMRIWDLLAEPVDRETVVQRLVEEFDAPEALVRAETGAFLDELHGAGFLEGLNDERVS